MYWAVRQICMAKHLRSRGWWGGWFTGQGENVHNGWLSLQHNRFTYTLIQLLPGLIDHRTFLFPALALALVCFSPFCTNYMTRCFHSFCSIAPVPGLQPELFIKKSEGTFWEREGGGGVGGGGFVRENRCRPPLWGRPFAGSHTLGIIRIYVRSSIPPRPLLCCRPISGQKGSPEHDSSLSAFDQNELCLLDSLWHFISPLCPPPLSVQHQEWNVQDRVHILLYACCHARTVRNKR